MDEPISKSQKKREADFLQKMGTQFIGLSLSKLELLPLSENLYKAIIDAKSMKSHGAKRRQAQLIGKLMRASDHQKILAAYEDLLEEDRAVSASFHEIEHWRSRLIHGGNQALTEFIELHHPEDVPHLRQLIRKAVDEEQTEKNTGGAKALFRYLRASIV